MPEVDNNEIPYSGWFKRNKKDRNDTDNDNALNKPEADGKENDSESNFELPPSF